MTTKAQSIEQEAYYLEDESRLTFLEDHEREGMSLEFDASGDHFLVSMTETEEKKGLKSYNITHFYLSIEDAKVLQYFLGEMMKEV